MKKTVTLALLLSLFSVLASQVSVTELLKWEKSIQTYLNQSDVEVYDLKVSTNDFTKDLSFSYDKEFADAPGVYVTFKCTGTADFDSYTVFNLDCEEEEPVLWDEF